LDEAGNYSLTHATVTFTFDDVAPVVVTTYPVSGSTYRQMARIYGTVEDGNAPRDISETRVMIYRVIAGATNYWVGGSNNWSASSAQGWNLVSNMNNQSGSLYNWNYSHTNFTNAPLTWTSGATYYIVTRAIDLAGNVAVESSTKTFVFDNVAPQSGPALPANDRAYRLTDLTVISGTSIDLTSSIASTKLSIMDEDANGGAHYFTGATFTATSESFLSVSQQFTSSWTYTSGFLNYSNGHHYVFKSSAADNIGNVEVPGAGNRILIDGDQPTAAITTPADGAVEDDNRTLLGNSSDPGFTNNVTVGIQGTGSGMYPSLPWQQGRVQVLVLLDESPSATPPGPVAYGSWDINDYFWDGSTWTLTTSYPVNPPWQDVSVDDNGLWSYTGLVGKWRRGKFYIAWVRAIDNAGNVQSSPVPGPLFQVAAKAVAFNVTGLSDGLAAGVDQSVTVEAIDDVGARAIAYQGTINFTAVGGAESMDDNNTSDDLHGLPKSYTFTTGDAGIHTFTNQVRFRKSGIRSIRVDDTTSSPTFFASHSTVTVIPAATERLLVMIPDGQSFVAGDKPSPTGSGRSGTPNAKDAGSTVVTQIRAVDKYWNVTTSSNPMANVTTSDPYDTDPGYMQITSTTSLNIIMTTAGNQTITASGAGVSNTSDNVLINAKSAQQLLAVLPGQTRTQGKYNVAPYGKTGSVSSIYAGDNMAVSVYAVDEYFNLDTNTNISVAANLPSDTYDVTPGPLTLVSGATGFTLVPVTAGSQIVRSTAVLTTPTYDSESFTVYADTTPGQMRIQLVFSNETAAPGLPPYGVQKGGKTGAPAAQYAGLGATVTVRLVDQYYNLINAGAAMPTVTLTSTDPNDENFSFDDQEVTLVSGVGQATMTFVTQNNPQSPITGPVRDQKGWVVTTSNTGGYTEDTSTHVVTWPYSITKLRVMAPGETAVEGDDPNGTGKTGTPSAGTAGTSYAITVQAVDNYWNINKGLGPLYGSGSGQQIDIESNDPYALNHATVPLTAGARTFSTFQPRLAQTNMTIWGYDAEAPITLSSQTIINITINPATADRYQVLLPGETAVPGSSTGKTGTANTQTAGTAIASPGVVVRLTDQYWNPISSGGLPWVTLTAPNAVDTYAVMPASAQMSLSAGAYQVAFISTAVIRTAGSALGHMLRATDPNGTYPGSFNSSNFTVVPNTLARLQIIMPGETAAAGRPANWGGGTSAAGKTGLPDSDGNNSLNTDGVSGNIDDFVAGTNYSVTVNAVDNFYNIVSTDAVVNLTSSDLNGTPSATPLTRTFVSGTTGYTVLFKTAQNSAASPITQTLTAASGSLVPDSTSSLGMTANSSSKILILLSGETMAPGTTLGKTGTISTATAGVDYPITVRLTDDYYNAVGNTLSAVDLRMTTTDPYDPSDPYDFSQLAIGTPNYEVQRDHQFQRATTTGWTVAVSTRSGPYYVPVTAGPVIVAPSTDTAKPHNLLVLLPGETFTPGKTTNPKGITGTPDFTAVLGHSNPRTGETFPVTVLAVDEFYNRVFDTDNPLVKLNADPTFYPTVTPSDTFTLNSGSATVNVTLKTAGSLSLTATEEAPAENIEYSTGTSSSFTVDVNSATQLQVLVQGESALPGSPTGKSGSVTTATAGNAYTVTVRAVDDNFNLVTSAGANVALSLTDPYDSPATITQPLASGATVYSVRFNTANGSGWRVNVSTTFGDALANGQSALVPVVANSPSKVLVAVNGQTHVPGDVTNSGISGTPSSVTAGSVLRATVTIVDNWYNTTTAATGNVWFVTTDPYDVEGTTLPLVSGTTSFPVQMVQSGAQTLTIYHLQGVYSTGTVSSIPVVAGAASRVLVTLPGESITNGKPPYTVGSGAGGKTGTPSNQTAGTSFSVNVYATDAYWNVATSALGVTLSAPADPNPTGVGSATLVSGATGYTATVFKAVDYNGFAQTISASVPGLANPNYTSPSFTVMPETAGTKKVRVLLPNQSAAPGTTVGKSGTAQGPATDNHFVAGTPVSITIDGTDAWGNILNVTPTIAFTTDDSYDANDPRLVTLVSGTSNFMHTFVTERTADTNETTASTFTVITATSTGYSAQSATLTVDDDDTVRHLQILVAGESAVPGSSVWPAGGKSGTPTTQTAGQAFNITVRAVDDYFNVVENPSVGGQPTVDIAATDPNVSLPLVPSAALTLGQLTQSVTLLTSTSGTNGGWLFVTTGAIGGFSFGTSTSSKVAVNAGAPSKLLILVPGESPIFGGTGKTGTPTAQTAGTTFNLAAGNIRAVDAYNNPVSTVGTVNVTMSDPYGTPTTQSVSISGGVNTLLVPITLAISTDTFSPQELYVSGLGLATSTSSAIPVNPGTPSRLQILAQGETAVPGSATGKTGTPDTATAGIAYTFTVNMTDARYNKIPQALQPTVAIQTVDTTAYATVSPSLAPLSSLGTTTFAMTFQRASATGFAVRTSTTSGSALSMPTPTDLSPAVVVLATTTDRIQLVLPGQVAVPGLTTGTARGLAGSPTAATAGTPYVVTANITDRFYNLKTDLVAPLPSVKIETTDLYDSHPSTQTFSNGTTTYAVVFNTAAGPWTITASTPSTYGGSPLGNFTSANVTVNPGAATKLQVLLPNETAVQGKPPYDSGENGGKTGTLPTFTAGSTFSVTINLVDPYFNKSNTENTIVQLYASDPFDQMHLLGSSATVNGTVTIDGAAFVTRTTTSAWQVYATTATGDAYALGVSTWANVNAGAVQRLVVLAPGESLQEGNPLGKTGTPNALVAGTTYQFTVQAVDTNFNQVPSANPAVAITFVGNSNSAYDDSYSELTRPAPQVLSGGATTFGVFLVTAENKQTVVIATTTGLTSGYSGVISPVAGPTEQYQILLPGETALPGAYTNNARGISGSPDTNSSIAGLQPFSAGSSFNVTVRAVDAYWNKTSVAPSPTLISSDSNDSPDPLSLTLTNGATTVSWTLKTSNPTPGWQLTADDGGTYTAFTSTWMPTISGVPTKYQVLLPGETSAPGTATGKTGSPTAWMAGVSSRVVVNLVDNYWNVITTAPGTNQVKLFSNTDMYASTVTLITLTNGTSSFYFTHYTATAATTLTAQRTAGLALANANSASFVVSANSPYQLLATVPGETYVAGKPPYDGTGGRLGSPTSVAAGTVFPVTVRAVDQYYNQVTPSAISQITTQDPYDTHPSPQPLTSGTTIYNILMQTENTAPGWTITASTTSGSATSMISNVSSAVPVTPGAAVKLQFILPGETAVPGLTTGGVKGKSGMPSNATAGVNYSATVRVTDNYYNVVTGTAALITVASSDPWDDETYSGNNPVAINPVSGDATVPVKFQTSSTWTLTATAPGFTVETSTDIYVRPGTADRYLIVLPGETHTPGKTTVPLGRTGTPTAQIAGVNATANVIITDAYYNKVSTASALISIETDDLYDVHPGTYNVAGEVAVSSVSLRTARAATIITAKGGFGSFNSSSFLVYPATASRIQLVLPGETAVPGNASLTRGVTGSPTQVLAGASIPIQVRITDNFWNIASATSTFPRVLTAGAPPPTASKAPISQAPPCGRGLPS
jgi:small nuclear ribonucleoprotein (snRNP)-like protein